MNVTKVKCELCGREISKNNYSKHIRRHENHLAKTIYLLYMIKICHHGIK